jgi:hypothetical protein
VSSAYNSIGAISKQEVRAFYAAHCHRSPQKLHSRTIMGTCVANRFQAFRRAGFRSHIGTRRYDSRHGAALLCHSCEKPLGSA